MCQQCKQAGLNAEYEAVLHNGFRAEVPAEVTQLEAYAPFHYRNVRAEWELNPEFEWILTGEDFNRESGIGISSLFEKLTRLPASVVSLLRAGKETIAVKMAIAAGMKNENDLTDLLLFNRHPELGKKRLVKGQPNFDSLAKEWLHLRNTIVRPALKPAPAPACNVKVIATPASVTINSRPCCMLTAEIPFFGNNFVEAGAVGDHKGGNEVNGIVYTGKAGFVDLGHLREMCDVTKVVFDQLNAAGGPPSVIRANRGIAKLRKCPADFMAVAKAISYDEGKGHEIVSFSKMSVGGHNSSFSPEDLCSNFLGTVVAERAIKSGGPFNDAVTTEIDKLLKDLDAQPLSETRNAFGLIKKKWVDFTDANSIRAIDYLKRRNFSHVPWKTGHKSDAATPLFIRNALPDFSATYSFVYTEGGVTVDKARWGAEMAKIKTKARTKYGPKFDKPV